MNENSKPEFSLTDGTIAEGVFTMEKKTSKKTSNKELGERKRIWLTEDQAAEYLNVSRRTLCEWRRDGCIPKPNGKIAPVPKCYKPAGKYYYDQNELDEWIYAGAL